MQKIPLEAEVSFWFAETIKHPSFINTLNEYQKSKLLEYAEERIHSALEFAIRFFENTTEANYPEGWPVERQLEYVVNQNCRSNFTPIRKVLNALGFDWNYEEGFHYLNKPQQPDQLEQQKPELSVHQIALLHVYQNKPIQKPPLNNNQAQRLAEHYGHKSGNNLYNTFINLEGNQAQRLQLSKRTPKKTLEDIEAIWPLLSEEERSGKPTEDQKKLNELIIKKQEE